MKKNLLITLFAIVGLFVSNNSMGINIIPIKYSNVRLIVTRNLPKGGSLVCLAGLTKNHDLTKPISSRICHSYTTDGVFHHRQSPKRIGVFTYYNGRYHFTYGGEDELKKAARNGGMGFMQWMVIYNYNPRKVKTFSAPHHFRVLAELKGKLCFIEADDPLTMTDFTNELVKLKVKYAIYLDTGEGWQNFYYKQDGKVNYKYRTWYPFPFRTNVLYFEE